MTSRHILAETSRAPPPEPMAIETKLAPLTLGDVTTDGMFEGYASLFEQEDLGHDVVAPGAFRNSLEARGADGVRMLFQHDPALPLGCWLKLYEDARGLFARGRLALAAAKAREVHALMKAGAIDGLSIGFRAVRGRRDRRTGVRRLEQIDLWEISVVTFPMQPAARVRSLKGSAPVRPGANAIELERWLIEGAGLTRAEAQAVLRDGIGGLDGLRRAGRLPTRNATLLQQIEDAARLLRRR